MTDRPHGRSLKWPAVLVRTARPDLSCCLRPWASYCPCNTTVWTNGLLLLTFTGHFLQATHGPSPKKAPCTMLNQYRGFATCSHGTTPPPPRLILAHTSALLHGHKDNNGSLPWYFDTCHQVLTCPGGTRVILYAQTNAHLNLLLCMVYIVAHISPTHALYSASLLIPISLLPSEQSLFSFANSFLNSVFLAQIQSHSLLCLYISFPHSLLYTVI